MSQHQSVEATSPSTHYEALTIHHGEPVSPDSCLLATAWAKGLFELEGEGHDLVRRSASG